MWGRRGGGGSDVQRPARKTIIINDGCSSQIRKSFSFFDLIIVHLRSDLIIF